MALIFDILRDFRGPVLKSFQNACHPYDKDSVLVLQILNEAFNHIRGFFK